MQILSLEIKAAAASQAEASELRRGLKGRQTSAPDGLRKQSSTVSLGASVHSCPQAKGKSICTCIQDKPKILLKTKMYFGRG